MYLFIIQLGLCRFLYFTVLLYYESVNLQSCSHSENDLRIVGKIEKMKELF